MPWYWRCIIPASGASKGLAVIRRRPASGLSSPRSEPGSDDECDCNEHILEEEDTLLRYKREQILQQISQREQILQQTVLRTWRELCFIFVEVADLLRAKQLKPLLPNVFVAWKSSFDVYRSRRFAWMRIVKQIVRRAVN